MKKFKQLFIRYLLLLMLAMILLSLIVVVPFRWLNPPITMVMMDRWLYSSNDNFKLKQTWLSWDDIPKQAALAVVTAEDQLFPLHQGFDVDSIMKSFRDSDKGGKLRGASTISQQVARNVYLWTGRSWLRKGIEAWFTLLIELTWGKQRILEVYLNIAEWGEGVFGLEAASHYHFEKSAKQLSPMQSALLASSLPSPLRFDPARPTQHLRDRAVWNLKQQKRLDGVHWLKQMD
ncbi:MAG: monofunctional biosynthetic peptidoglycan transglycosylase [Pseudomonadota bacterium]|nr:monofunctional biosynthetic peptidoglycan transglycosylase [Pseudomonadota bacterium]MDO7710494.1 monofunctional biosynthetic peptidoglycan transglycosylase [Pseudomonadota bacterium]